MSSYAARFSVAALATWRVTHLLAREDGPADVIVRGRQRLGDSSVGALMDCFQCLSLWTAAPIAIVATPGRARVTWWLALSAAACLLERATSAEEVDDGLLWETPGGAEEDDSPAGGRSAAGAAGPAGADGPTDGRTAAEPSGGAAVVAAAARTAAMRTVA
jgi:hypothetical protein